MPSWRRRSAPGTRRSKRLSRSRRPRPAVSTVCGSRPSSTPALPRPRAPVVGDVIGDRYELDELVGRGGMSSVYKAHDRLLERDVALKVLHPQFTADTDYVERFRREARSVAQLSHPNIVTVIDRGEQDDRQFIVFEYVAGENLK